MKNIDGVRHEGDKKKQAPLSIAKMAFVQNSKFKMRYLKESKDVDALIHSLHNKNCSAFTRPNMKACERFPYVIIQPYMINNAETKVPSAITQFPPPLDLPPSFPSPLFPNPLSPIHPPSLSSPISPLPFLGHSARWRGAVLLFPWQGWSAGTCVQVRSNDFRRKRIQSTEGRYLRSIPLRRRYPRGHYGKSIG